MPVGVDDILKHAHLVESRANALSDDLTAQLEAVREALIGRLATIQEDFQGNLADASLKRRKAILARQKAEVEAILERVYQDTMPDIINVAAKDVMLATGAVVVGSFMKAGFDMPKLPKKPAAFEVVLEIKVHIPPKKPPVRIPKRAVLEWFDSAMVEGRVIGEWLAKLQAAARDRIVAVGRQALEEGLGVDGMARLLRKKGIQGSVPGLRGLSSTLLQSASTYAQEKTTEKIFNDVLKGWRRLGTLDGRTCLACGALDGKVYPVGEPKPSLPAHWRCRCRYVPETDLDHTGATRPATKHSERWVNHRDGSRSRKFTVESAEQLPAGTSYQSWMKRQLEQDPAFVRKVLGMTRFELFKAGKLNLNRMVGYGRIKSLDEMRA